MREHTVRDLYGLTHPWAVSRTDYQGNTGITTADGLYVCSVPHEVAAQIVADHGAAQQVADLLDLIHEHGSEELRAMADELVGAESRGR